MVPLIIAYGKAERYYTIGWNSWRVNFYYLNGKPVARMAGGGFNGKAIKTQKSMQRVRKNGSEFGNCSRVNKVFRQALQAFYLSHRFTFFHNKLMGLFTGLKTLDAINTRGARCVAKGVETAIGKKQLVDFCYTPSCTPSLVLPFDYAIDWQTYQFTMATFNIEAVVFIKGATHIAIQFGVLDFNFETLIFDLHLADRLVLSKTDARNHLNLTPNSLPTGIGVLLAVVGVRYYQELDGDLYLLNGEHGVGFSVVGVV